MTKEKNTVEGEKPHVSIDPKQECSPLKKLGFSANVDKHHFHPPSPHIPNLSVKQGGGFLRDALIYEAGW